MIVLSELDSSIGCYEEGERVNLSGLSTGFVTELFKEKVSGCQTIHLKTLLNRCKGLELNDNELVRLHSILVKSRLWSDAEFFQALLKYYISRNSPDAKMIFCDALVIAKNNNSDFLSSFFVLHLKKGAKGNAKSSKIVKFFIENPFCLNISYRSVETLQLLLNAGASIHDSTYFGTAFLRWCLDSGKILFFQKMLTLGAHICPLFNPRPIPSLIKFLHGDKEGSTLTTVDCFNKLLEMKLTVSEHSLGSLLYKAIFAQDVAFAQILIAKGANPNQRNPDGMTPLLMICNTIFSEASDQLEFLVLLLDKADMLAKTVNDLNALHLLCSVQAPLSVIEHLLKKQFPIDLTDKHGLTAFDYAFKNENIPMMLLLMRYGSDGFNKYSNDDYLIMIEDQRNTLLLTKIIERGFDINSLDADKKSLLHKAADHRNLEWVQFLISHGADVNLSTKRGTTPLMHAIDLDLRVTACLIENGSKLFSLRECGRCAMDYLMRKDLSPIIAYFATRFLDLEVLSGFYPMSMTKAGLKEFSRAVIEAINAHVPFPDLFPFLSFSFLFNFPDLSAKIIQYIPENELKPTLRRLYRFYPELLDNLPYVMKHMMQFQKGHLKANSLEVIVPEAPSESNVDHLLTLFNEINFTNPTDPNYINYNKIINEHGVLMTPELMKTSLVKLCHFVKNRIPYVGTPPTDTPELEFFYLKLENYLKHISFFLGKMENTSLRATHVIDMALSGEHCGMRWLGDSFEKYMHLHHPDHFPTFQDQVYDELTKLRSGLLRLVSGSDVHDYSQTVRMLGIPLGIPGAVGMLDISDIFRPNFEGPSFKTLYNDFLKAYHPHRIFEITSVFLNQMLKKNADLIHGWMRENIPSDWRKSFFDELNRTISKTMPLLPYYNAVLENHGIPPLKRVADFQKHIQEFKVATFMDEEFFDFGKNCLTIETILIVLRTLNILTESRRGILECLLFANQEETQNKKLLSDQSY